MIHHDQRGALAVVTIDRPERRNALDRAALDGLEAAVAAATAAGARALALIGAGGHFCAGADLGGVDGPAFVARLGQVLDGLRAAPFPVVAGIEGAALGAGLQLALACDLRVVHAQARLGVPAARLGLMVDQATMGQLVAALGEGPARAMLLAAATYRGDEVHRLGFAQRLGGAAEAVTWAEEVAALAPLALAGHKLGLAGADPGPYEAAFTRAWGSADRVEGTAAFRDRRPPEFRGA